MIAAVKHKHCKLLAFGSGVLQRLCYITRQSITTALGARFRTVGCKQLINKASKRSISGFVIMG